MWYEVEEEYGRYLCNERADGILVNLLLYAMEHDYDIVSECPISEQLYFSLTSFLIPAISKNIKKYHLISIEAELNSNVLPCEHKVGGSISGGVDSFYTLLKNSNRREEKFNITHACFFNAGASGATGGEYARERYRARIDWIKDVCDDLSLKMVCVDTNINEFLKQDHEPTHSFRTLAIPLILQKLFSKYYFASGFEYANFAFNEGDTASYDLLTTQCISTENLEFYLSGSETSRIEKLEFLSNQSIVQRRLNVCTADIVNCSHCDKCVRTMLALYALGRLQDFKVVFDCDYFNTHKHQLYRRMVALKGWRQCSSKNDWEEIYQRLKDEITIIDRVGGLFVRLYRITRRIVYRTDFGKKIYERIRK